MAGLAESQHALVAQYLSRYPGEAAADLEELAPEDVELQLRELPVALGVSVLGRMRHEHAAETLAAAGLERAADLLRELDPDRATALLARLEPERREALLQRLPAQRVAELRELLAYPPDSAGRLMDAHVSTFRVDNTADQALDHLRRLGERRHDVFLVDGDGKLLGSVTVQELALADPQQQLGALVRTTPAQVQALAPRAEVVEELERRRAVSLAVVAFDGTLIGVIRPAGLVAAAQAAASVDIQTMVGASKDERALSPALFAVRKRLPWLQVNLLTAFLAAAVVGLFEDTIAQFTALAVLLPVVAGQSGNTGSQALAVTMRGLALREIRVRHWWRVGLKEVSAAALNGLAVAATTCLAVWFWSGSPGLTFVIGISMVISMTLAGLAGALIPMLLTSLGQDPAQSSSIVLTTVTDVVGFMSFLGIATALSFAL